MWEPMACRNSPMEGMLYPQGSIYRFGDGVLFCVIHPPFSRTLLGILSIQLPFHGSFGVCGEVDCFVFILENISKSVI